MNLTQTLGWTLLHFVWQGTLIAATLAMALAILRQARPAVRYLLGCSAMLLMFLSAAITFLNLELAKPAPMPVAVALGSMATFAATAAIQPAEAARMFGDYLPFVVWAWFGGVLALSIRSLGGWMVAHRFARSHTRPAAPEWEEKFRELAKRLSISRQVRLAVSTLAEVPAAIGWLQPVVLAPIGIFVGLNTEQVEALLAHELAHIRRHDYLVNLFQTAVETLLFFHPAVWWVSRLIRAERENCCDDLAVEICGNPVSYVRALTELEEMRSRRNVPGMAMAADGGSLLYRVQRLLRLKQGTAGPSGWIALLAIVACLSVVGIAVNAWAQRPEKAPEAPVSAPQPAPAAPGTKTIWLDEIQAAGFRDLDVDQLIAMKIHGVTGDYIRQLRANGFELNADQLVAFRIHEVTPGYISELKQAGISPLTADDLIALRIHGAEPAWIRQIQSLGYPKISADDLITLRIHDITPEFIRDARSRFKDITLDQIIALKLHGILADGGDFHDREAAMVDVQELIRGVERRINQAVRALDR